MLVLSIAFYAAIVVGSSRMNAVDMALLKSKSRSKEAGRLRRKSSIGYCKVNERL